MTFEEWWRSPREVPQTEYAAKEAFVAGAASRDAEIAQLNKEAAEKFSALAKEYDQLRAELEYDQRNAAMSQSESARLLDENTKLPEGTEMTMPKFEPVAYQSSRNGFICKENKNPEYNINLHTADQLTEAYEAGKREQAAELEAARAENKMLLDGRNVISAYMIKQLHEQLAAEQAKNIGLRGVLKTIYEDFDCDKNAHDYGTDCRCCIAEKAISTPSDTSALETYVDKACEKTKEAIYPLLNGITQCESDSAEGWWETSTGAAFGSSVLAAIRALPAVTLDDLKGGA